MPSPILARADALMQRRRPNADADDVPVLTDAIDVTDGDDDIPVLLDVEAIAPLLPADEATSPELAPADTAESPDSADEARPASIVTAEPAATVQPLPVASAPSRADLARDIARRVEMRLAAELPHIVAAAVRDYLAERPEQPDETGSD